jgi:hypothetical protein
MKNIIALILLSATPLVAQQFGQVGTSGAQFLKINFDPRASGLGYAGASVVSGAAAVYTNVAGLEGVKSFDLSAGYVPWFADIKMASVSVGYRLQDVGVVGIQASGFSTEEEITTVEMENGTGQMYSIKNYAVGLSFARHITDKLSAGIQAKYILESYYNQSTSGLAFDVGTNYELGFYGARIALSLQNFGANLPALSGSYQDYSDSDSLKSFNSVPLPVMFRASFTIQPIVTETYSVRMIVDLVHPNDNIEHYNIGSEVTVMNTFSFRGGVKLNYDNESFAFGIGVDGSQLVGQNFRLDYSYEQFSVLPSIQKIALGFAF